MNDNIVTMNAASFQQIEVQEVIIPINGLKCLFKFTPVNVIDVIATTGKASVLKIDVNVEQKNKSGKELLELSIDEKQLQIDIIHTSLKYDEDETPLDKDQIGKLPTYVVQTLFDYCSGQVEVLAIHRFPVEDLSDEG